MSNPYREGSTPAGNIDCPRCGKPLPPLDIAACPDECGTWVSAQVSTVTFDPDEVRENLVTRWWRVRAPCPICAEKMTLRGLDDIHFQGCDQHGFWVDADTISKTGLVRPDLRERIQRVHDDADAQRAELERRARIKEKADRDRERADAQARLDADARERQRAEREAIRERQRTAAMRTSIEKNVIRALASGNAASLVDEIVRLQEMIVDLAERLTDVENQLRKG